MAQALQLMTGTTSLVLAPRQKRPARTPDLIEEPDEDTSVDAIKKAIERKEMAMLNRIAESIYMRGRGEQ